MLFCLSLDPATRRFLSLSFSRILERDWAPTAFRSDAIIWAADQRKNIRDKETRELERWAQKREKSISEMKFRSLSLRLCKFLSILSDFIPSKKGLKLIYWVKYFFLLSNRQILSALVKVKVKNEAGGSAITNTVKLAKMAENLSAAKNVR